MTWLVLSWLAGHRQPKIIASPQRNGVAGAACTWPYVDTYVKQRQPRQEFIHLPGKVEVQHSWYSYLKAIYAWSILFSTTY